MEKSHQVPPQKDNIVGVLWEDTMLLHKTEIDDPDDKAPHVENPKRLSEILHNLK